MSAFALAFLISLIITLLVVRYSHLHDHITADHDILVLIGPAGTP